MPDQTTPVAKPLVTASEAPGSAQSNQAQMGFGWVRHTRFRPARNHFAYRTFFLLLPMRTLCHDTSATALAINRRGLVSFHDADHGLGQAGRGAALAWVESLLVEQGITDAKGEIWLQTYPRVWGYSFKPVSFWYCHREDGTLRAILAEVNNTFGERHVYLLDQPRWGQTSVAQKVFHVSPFCQVLGQYRFRFMRTATHAVARIDHDDDLGALLATSVSGELRPITTPNLRWAMWAYPAQSVGVMLRIHWQALKLLFKKVPFFSKPKPPEGWVTRSSHPGVLS